MFNALNGDIVIMKKNREYSGYKIPECPFPPSDKPVHPKVLEFARSLGHLVAWEHMNNIGLKELEEDEEYLLLLLTRYLSCRGFVAAFAC